MSVLEQAGFHTSLLRCPQASSAPIHFTTARAAVHAAEDWDRCIIGRQLTVRTGNTVLQQQNASANGLWHLCPNLQSSIVEVAQDVAKLLGLVLKSIFRGMCFPSS